MYTSDIAYTERIKMSKIFATVYGSHLYGTNIESSDTDIKSIHKDSLRNIILKKGHDNVFTQTNSTSANTKDDVDFESKELREFIRGCLSGQTYALDMLFSPKNLWMETSKTWEDIQTHKEKLVSKNVKPFIGYCQGQARKYSDKCLKLDELSRLKTALENSDLTLTLKDAIATLDFSDFKHIKVYQKFNSSSQQMDEMLEVADADYPLNRKAADVYKSVNDKVSNYGKRVQLARVSNGCDFKAFYHAFRVAWELEELLTTGKITFPNFRKNELLAIRSQQFGREYIESWLSSEIERILAIPNELPEADYTFWEDWIVNEYLGDNKC